MDLIITIPPVVTKDLPISPRFTPYDFLSRCKFSTLTTRQPMVEFYLLTFPRFPLRKKEHKSYFGKNRTHDFRTSRCAAYLLDHSGDERLLRGRYCMVWHGTVLLCGVPLLAIDRPKSMSPNVHPISSHLKHTQALARVHPGTFRNRKNRTERSLNDVFLFQKMQHSLLLLLILIMQGAAVAAKPRP